MFLGSPWEAVEKSFLGSLWEAVEKSFLGSPWEVLFGKGRPWEVTGKSLRCLWKVDEKFLGNFLRRSLGSRRDILGGPWGVLGRSLGSHRKATGNPLGIVEMT